MITGEKTEIVLDTNVLVSSALSQGKPYRILSLAEDEDIVSVTSPSIIDELRDVLSRDRLPFTEDQVDELSMKILSISRVLEPQFNLEEIGDDPDDDKILENRGRRRRGLHRLRRFPPAGPRRIRGDHNRRSRRLPHRNQWSVRLTAVHLSNVVD